MYKNNIEKQVIELSEAIEMKDRHIEQQLRSSEVSELSKVTKIKDL
jgi:hypothetical protein